MMPLISILIPAYNAEKTIRETLLSAINQTWGNKEVIVVDDGSTDATLQIAQRFESQIVKVITQANCGASAARNKALLFAQGDYIQWLDADDLLAPDKISTQLRGADNGQTSRVLLSSAFGTFFVQPHKARFVPHALWQDLEPTDFLLTLFTQNLWMGNCAWLVSRKLTDMAGPWDERLSFDDDGEYFSRVMAVSECVKFVKKARSYYRQYNAASLSKSLSDKACKSLLLSLSLRIGQLRRLEDSERTREASIQLLQTWLECFYPEKQALLSQVYELAQELGGTLLPPRLSWKYLPVKMLFGWKTTKQVKTIVSNTKLFAYVQYDRLLLALSGR